MRGGEALSAYLMYVLIQVPESVYRPEEALLEKGLQFLRKHINDKGVLGCQDPDILDYPNYATAHALMVLKHFNKSGDRSLIRRMESYLFQQQFCEQRGIDSTNAAYGAWGFGESRLQAGQTGHVDLSHTRRILTALRGSKGYAASAKKANCFLRLAQKQSEEVRIHATGVPHRSIPYDGGFFASPVTVGTNKGGVAVDSTEAPHYFRSYATATCDGILGLLAAGFDKDSPPVTDAFQWLLAHPNWQYPEGIPLDDPDQWHEVMFYYHLAVRSEVYALLDSEVNWRPVVEGLLVSRQQPDGSFSNPMGGPNKEDDPMLATAFAVQAFCCLIDQTASM